MSLPKVTEYAPAAARHFWKDVFRLVLFLAFLVVLIAVVQVIQYRVVLTQWFNDRYGLGEGARVFGAVFMGAFVALLGIEAAGLYALYRLRKRRARANPVLSCPHCQAELIPMSRVIASKRCPSCRRRVLAEPEPQPVTSEG